MNARRLCMRDLLKKDQREIRVQTFQKTQSLMCVSVRTPPSMAAYNMHIPTMSTTVFR